MIFRVLVFSVILSVALTIALIVVADRCVNDPYGHPLELDAAPLVH